MAIEHREIEYWKVRALEQAFDDLQDVQDLLFFEEARQVKEGVNKTMIAIERALARLEGR